MTDHPGARTENQRVFCPKCGAWDGCQCAGTKEHRARPGLSDEVDAKPGASAGPKAEKAGETCSRPSNELLYACGCAELYGSHHSECPAQRQFDTQRAEIERLRAALGTEKAMHQAWRKRAEHSEQETGRFRKLLTEWLSQAERWSFLREDTRRALSSENHTAVETSGELSLRWETILWRSLNRLHYAVIDCAHIGFQESSPTTNADHAEVWNNLNAAQKDAALKLETYSKTKAPAEETRAVHQMTEPEREAMQRALERSQTVIDDGSENGSDAP